MFVKRIENINDLIEIFEEISEDIDVNGQDRDFYEIRFMKEEIKTDNTNLKEHKSYYEYYMPTNWITYKKRINF